MLRTKFTTLAYSNITSPGEFLLLNKKGGVL